MRRPDAASRANGRPATTVSGIRADDGRQGDEMGNVAGRGIGSGGSGGLYAGMASGRLGVLRSELLVRNPGSKNTPRRAELGNRCLRATRFGASHALVRNRRRLAPRTCRFNRRAAV